MIKLQRHALFFIAPLLLSLNSCATAPGPYSGAPVVDRSVRPTQPSAPATTPDASQAEVRPLARPEPFQPHQFPNAAVPGTDYDTPDSLPPGAAAPAQPDTAYPEAPAPTPAPKPPTRVAPPTPAAPVNAAPAPAPNLPPAELSRQGNQPVVALLDSASRYVNAGELDKAAASLERALRIEPRNAGIWYDLAQIRLHQHQYQQAESLAVKSNSLAGGNSALRARNWRLISVARRAQGNNAGADEAEAQASVQGR